MNSPTRVGNDPMTNQSPTTAPTSPPSPTSPPEPTTNDEEETSNETTNEDEETTTPEVTSPPTSGNDRPNESGDDDRLDPQDDPKAELERIRHERPRMHEAHVRQSDNKGPDTTATLEPLARADPEMWLGTNGDPDVLVSIPNLGVDRIYLGIDDVHARVDLYAKVLDLVELRVGAEVSVKKIELEIDNVRVQAMVKVRLEEVTKIVHDVVSLIDHHPEILTNLTGGLGRGLEGALAGGRTVQHELEGQQRAARMGAAMPEMPAMPEMKEPDESPDDSSKEDGLDDDGAGTQRS